MLRLFIALSLLFPCASSWADDASKLVWRVEAELFRHGDHANERASKSVRREPQGLSDHHARTLYVDHHSGGAQAATNRRRSDQRLPIHVRLYRPASG